MRLPHAAVLLHLALLTSRVEAVECPQLPPVLSISEYRSQLEQIATEVKAAKTDSDYTDVSSCLPDHWTVQDGGSTFDISSWAIRNSIYDLRQEKDPEDRSDAVDSLDEMLTAMRDRAGLYDNRSFSAERAQLNRILARPEFRNAVRRGWADRWKEWLTNHLLILLGRSSAHVSAMLTFLQLLAWTVVLLVLALLMRTLFRWLKADAPASFGVATMPVSATHWTNWLQQARAAANASDWRRAIHFAYWAAISYLEGEGCWPADRARTPREYVRLMREETDRRNRLVSLTKRFEYFWYAQHPATELDYQDTLKQLEALGCL